MTVPDAHRTWALHALADDPVEHLIAGQAFLQLRDVATQTRAAAEHGVDETRAGHVTVQKGRHIIPHATRHRHHHADMLRVHCYNGEGAL